MDAPDLVRLDADDWRDFRDVRLASLADAPGAFGSRHADWVDATEERWRARLTDVPLTIVARSDAGYERAGFTDLGVPADWPADGLPERRMRSAVDES